MKSIAESIIGRRGNAAKIRKDDLVPGYIVMTRDGHIGTYFDYDTAAHTPRISSCIPQMHNEGGFFTLDSMDTLCWMPMDRYDDNLEYVGRDNPDLDITAVWPIKMSPRLLGADELVKITRKSTPIKINQ